MFKLNDMVFVVEGVFEGRYGVIKEADYELFQYKVVLLGDDKPLTFDDDELELCSPKEYMIEMMETCIDLETPFFYVLVESPNSPDSELIINPLVNIEAKLEYYSKAYDNDLSLIANRDIKIVGFGMCECLDFIEEQVYDDFDYGNIDDYEEYLETLHVEKRKPITATEFEGLQYGTKVYVEYNRDYWTIKVDDGVETVTYDDEKDLLGADETFMGHVSEHINDGDIKVYLIDEDERKPLTFKEYDALPLGSKVYIEYDKEYWSIPSAVDGERTIVEGATGKTLESESGIRLGDVKSCYDYECIKLYLIEDKKEEIKVGDIVKIQDVVNPYTRFNGMIGKVVEYDEDAIFWNYNIKVFGEKDDKLAFDSDEITKFNGFVKGDKVKVVDCIGDDVTDCTGKTGIVIGENTNRDYPIETRTDDDLIAYFKVEELQFNI